MVYFCVSSAHCICVFLTDLKYQRSLIHSKAASHDATALLGHLAIRQQRGYLQQESFSELMITLYPK